MPSAAVDTSNRGWSAVDTAVTGSAAHPPTSGRASAIRRVERFMWCLRREK
jgi:hypothetical protein